MGDKAKYVIRSAFKVMWIKCAFWYVAVVSCLE